MPSRPAHDRRKRAGERDAVDAALDAIGRADELHRAVFDDQTIDGETLRQRRRRRNSRAPMGWRPGRPFAQQRNLEHRAGDGDLGQAGTAGDRLHSDILIRMSSAVNRVRARDVFAIDARRCR